MYLADFCTIRESSTVVKKADWASNFSSRIPTFPSVTQNSFWKIGIMVFGLARMLIWERIAARSNRSSTYADAIDFAASDGHTEIEAGVVGLLQVYHAE